MYMFNISTICSFNILNAQLVKSVDTEARNMRVDHIGKNLSAGRQCLTLVILATEEGQIRRIMVQSQPGQIVQENLSQKNK
jgi:hypothetical protein